MDDDQHMISTEVQDRGYTIGRNIYYMEGDAIVHGSDAMDILHAARPVEALLRILMMCLTLLRR